MSLKDKQTKRHSRGAMTIEFVFAMIIFAAMLAPVIPEVVDMGKEVMREVQERVVPHWP